MLTMVLSNFAPVSRNKYLDADGDVIFPSPEELFNMTAEDKEELHRALGS